MIEKFGMNKQSVFCKMQFNSILRSLKDTSVPEIVNEMQCSDKFYFLTGANWKVARRIAGDSVNYVPEAEEYSEPLPGNGLNVAFHILTKLCEYPHFTP